VKPLGKSVTIHATVDEVARPDEPESRPCAHCGRPVPQRASAGRPFRYCRDNEDACLRAARNARMRQRTAPGLIGQVAQAFEIVDRLDRAVETLSEALHTELSPDGVERALTQVRADTTARIAAAQAERDEARREAVQVRTEATRRWEEAQQVRAEAARTVEAALVEADAARQLATDAVALADERVAAAQAETQEAERITADALVRTGQAQADRDAARAAAATAEALRDQAIAERNGLRAEVAEAIRARDAAQTETRLTAAAAQEAAARAEAAAAEVARVRAAAEHAAAAAEERSRRLRGELTEQIGQLRSAVRASDQRVTDLTERLRAAESERDTARRDMAAAQAHADQLAAQVGQLATVLARLSQPAPS
jgi:chromosome segregation ATPase